MKTWKLEITMKVADSWIADGFNMEERIEDIQEQMAGMLPYAYGHEVVVNVKITSKPDKKAIEALQSGELEPKD